MIPAKIAGWWIQFKISDMGLNRGCPLRSPVVLKSARDANSVMHEAFFKE
jgi:hypothetical protein